MDRLIRQIPVRDDRGVELTLYEFANVREFRTTRGARQVPGRKRYALHTGEAVTYVDEDNFELVSTGETLFRISAPYAGTV
jgi:hypothetical protein